MSSMATFVSQKCCSLGRPTSNLGQRRTIFDQQGVTLLQRLVHTLNCASVQAVLLPAQWRYASNKYAMTICIVRTVIMRTSCVDLCLYDCRERISNLSVYDCIGSKYVPASHLKYAGCCRNMYAKQQNYTYPLS